MELTPKQKRLNLRRAILWAIPTVLQLHEEKLQRRRNPNSVPLYLLKRMVKSLHELVTRRDWTLAEMEISDTKSMWRHMKDDYNYILENCIRTRRIAHDVPGPVAWETYRQLSSIKNIVFF
ncbi:hypothetical protein QAD02_003414 [Eretmocerus hayati]|uniref:Uncharacterized protein n=1 Tax=Eretmocerus hayati TaxID=131215 RepID=A0ACC2NLT8_9HYME|nr:hypothetical protein QAD02_003414 [Eretmocerus hayati]